jgi:hypothetical protein
MNFIVQNALQFDSNTIFVSKNYIDGLEKLTDETN